MYCQVINKTKGKILAKSAQEARSFLGRLCGLMFKSSIGEQEALIFYKASSIHTFFMRFPIDILFLDKDYKVLRVVKNLRPWRAVTCFNSSVTIEFSSQNNNTQDTEISDLVEIGGL